MKTLLSVAPLLALLFVLSPAIAAPEESVSVDYVLGMLQAGMDQDTIIQHIVERKVRFTLAEGDVERLRGAGARDGLVAVVRNASGDSVSGQAVGSEGEIESRPRRIESGEEGEAEERDGERAPVYSYGFAYYSPWFGWYPYYSYPAFYGYPGYYSPYYYYGFGGHISHSRRHGHSVGLHGTRVAPRGGSHSRGGGHMRSAPRGGSHSRGGGHMRSAPRGSSRSPRGR